MSFTRPLLVSFGHEHTAQAVRDVLELVRPDGGRLEVISVVPPAPALQRLLMSRTTEEQLDARLVEAAHDDLARWVQRATHRAHPDDVGLDVVRGHPVEAALRRVVEHGHDLLAVTGHHDDAATRAVITRLQRKSPCPVWSIRPSRARRRRVLAAVDVDDTHRGLNDRLLDAAAWLAGPDGELHVATAWELLGEATLRSSPFLEQDPREIDELRTACERDHERRLGALLAEHRLGGHSCTTHVRHGAPADVVAAVTERHHINQLVVGTLGRSGIPGFVMGNTAEQLLADVTCSVLVVKPPGFTSAYAA
jgi:nucleotide-binding universal stress UspA family protein